MHQMSIVRIIRLTSDASLGKKLNDFRFVSFLFEPLTWSRLNCDAGSQILRSVLHSL